MFPRWNKMWNASKVFRESKFLYLSYYKCIYTCYFWECVFLNTYIFICKIDEEMKELLLTFNAWHISRDINYFLQNLCFEIQKWININFAYESSCCEKKGIFKQYFLLQEIFNQIFAFKTENSSIKFKEYITKTYSL